MTQKIPRKFFFPRIIFKFDNQTSNTHTKLQHKLQQWESIPENKK